MSSKRPRPYENTNHPTVAAIGYVLDGAASLFRLVIGLMIFFGVVSVVAVVTLIVLGVRWYLGA